MGFSGFVFAVAAGSVMDASAVGAGNSNLSIAVPGHADAIIRGNTVVCREIIALICRIDHICYGAVFAHSLARLAGGRRLCHVRTRCYRDGVGRRLWLSGKGTAFKEFLYHIGRRTAVIDDAIDAVDKAGSDLRSAVIVHACSRFFGTSGE